MAPGAWSRCHRSPAGTAGGVPPRLLRSSRTDGVFAGRPARPVAGSSGASTRTSACGRHRAHLVEDLRLLCLAHVPYRGRTRSCRLARCTASSTSPLIGFSADANHSVWSANFSRQRQVPTPWLAPRSARDSLPRLSALVVANELPSRGTPECQQLSSFSLPLFCDGARAGVFHVHLRSGRTGSSARAAATALSNWRMLAQQLGPAREHLHSSMPPRSGPQLGPGI